MNLSLRIAALTITAILALLALASGLADSVAIPLAVLAAVAVGIQGLQLQRTLSQQLGDAPRPCSHWPASWHVERSGTCTHNPPSPAPFEITCNESPPG